ncbi:hypothetical protein GTP81_31475, partial [Rugamonas sp. FT107W]|nr:hypothetical protein [Duganella vulcania]
MDTRLRGHDGGHRLSDETSGMLLGLIAVTIFSLTLPFTRLAVGGGETGGEAGAGLPATFVALGRALVKGRVRLKMVTA